MPRDASAPWGRLSGSTRSPTTWRCSPWSDPPASSADRAALSTPSYGFEMSLWFECSQCRARGSILSLRSTSSLPSPHEMNVSRIPSSVCRVSRPRRSLVGVGALPPAERVPAVVALEDVVAKSAHQDIHSAPADEQGAEGQRGHGAGAGLETVIVSSRSRASTTKLVTDDCLHMPTPLINSQGPPATLIGFASASLKL